MLAPSVPLAPTRFSTTTIWPSAPASLLPTSRATRSSAGPGGNGATNVIGFAVGQGCADVGATANGSVTRAHAAMRRKRVIGMSMELFLSVKGRRDLLRDYSLSSRLMLQVGIKQKCQHDL